jgi:ubiquinone biosynthesis protein UbiJ
MSLLDPLVAYGAQGVLAAINFSIERDDDLHAAMRGLAGKTLAFRLDMPGVLDGLSFYGSFAQDGLLEAVRAEPGPAAPSQATPSQTVPPDVTLWLTGAFFSNMAGQATASLWPQANTKETDRAAGRLGAASSPSGPAALQGVRIEGDAALAQRLMPLLEVMRDRLSPFQLAIARFPLVGAAQRAAQYVVYDAGILLRREELTAHAQALRALRERIDRLEKRVRAGV